MNDPGTSGLLITLVIVALLAIGAWLLVQWKRSRELEKRFGPEYRRAVQQHGSRAKAEQELVARQQRVEKLHIVPLSVPDASRFGAAWRDVQARFVDDPRGALWQADALVRELMQARGYPIGNDFDRCASDISVDHPHVVNHFRAAQAILDRDRQAPVDTETMRKAIVHYRALFDDLLQTEQEPATVYAQPMEARR